jgi:23S rRNA (adenine2503-C2)-methyltransferase
MQNDRRFIFEASLAELREWCEAHGEPAYRAGQIRRWVTERRCADFAAMTDLPQALRNALASDWDVFSSHVEHRAVDRDQSVKLLLRLADATSVECVLLCAPHRWTACLSTQVGCGMGCVFCASGLGGLVRNLTTSEMIEELQHLTRELPASERLSHIVVMGMGEPLANLDSLLDALDFATSPDGLGISGRHVTISTVGLPAKIARLAESGRPYHLAVSLHAPTDELRRQLVPLAEKVSLAELLTAADNYRAVTGRQVTFEYVLLAGVNDQPEHARALGRLLAGRDAMINLIPYNPVAELGYRRPSAQRVSEFAAALRIRDFVVRIRKRKGANIDAACGQLRRAYDSLATLA